MASNIDKEEQEVAQKKIVYNKMKWMELEILYFFCYGRRKGKASFLLLTLVAHKQTIIMTTSTQKEAHMKTTNVEKLEND